MADLKFYPTVFERKLATWQDSLGRSVVITNGLDMKGYSEVWPFLFEQGRPTRECDGEGERACRLYFLGKVNHNRFSDAFDFVIFAESEFLDGRVGGKVNPFFHNHGCFYLQGPRRDQDLCVMDSAIRGNLHELIAPCICREGCGCDPVVG